MGFFFHNVMLPFQLCGMGQRMHLFERSYTDLRIDLRGIKLGTAGKLLDAAEIGAVRQHQRGAGMPPVSFTR